MKIVKDLLFKYSFEQVYEKLIALYSGQEKNKEGYNLAWSVLEKLITVENNDRFLVSTNESHDNESWVSIGYIYNEQEYAIDLVMWEQILGFNISKVTASIDLIAHLLWEMTFYTYDNYKLTGDFAEIV